MLKKYDNRKYIKIASLENIVEADIAEQLLKETGMPYYIKEMDDPCYAGVYPMIYGYAEVWAPEDYEEDIKQLLDEMKKEVVVFDEASLTQEPWK